MRPEDLNGNDLTPGSELSGGADSDELINEILRQEATWADPPPEVADNLLAAMGRTGPTDQSSQPSERRRRWPVVAALVGTAAIVIGLLWWPFGGTTEPDDTTVVALEGTGLAPAVAGKASVGPRPSGWWIRLDLTGLAPAREGSYYEGWVLSESDAVSIGTFHMRDGEDPVVLWSGVSLVDYPTLAVTLQDEGGGQEPSNRVILTGPIEGLEDR